MNVQLLLLLALAGPFCAFTHASPTAIPTELETRFSTLDHGGKETETTVGNLPTWPYLVTGPPPTVQHVASEEATAEVPFETTSFAIIGHTEESVTETEIVTAAAEATEHLASVQETTAPPEETETEDHTVAIEATAATEIQPEVTATAEVRPELTEAPDVQPEVQFQVTEAPEVQTELAVATNAEMGQDEDVVLENGTEGELSSGQVIGIVIGCLLVVLIVIAVVIVVVRRMGKYSP